MESNTENKKDVTEISPTNDQTNGQIHQNSYENINPEMLNKIPNPSLPISANTQNPLAHTSSNTGQIILQWLTYALWGWTVLVMSILTGMVLASILADADISSIAYPVAAVLVLMPVAFIADLFYSKQEPEVKTGAASIVMVLHAVLFALLGVGSLIVVVFCLVNLLTNGEDSKGVTATLYSFIIIAFLYALTLLRTLAPKNIPQVKKYYRVIMIIIVGLVALAGILGPAAKERSTRGDRLIENNLANVKYEIDQYVNDTGKLPDNSDQLKLYGDSAKLFSQKLVIYKPNTEQPVKKPSEIYNYDQNGKKSIVTPTKYDTTYFYQLCANYKHEKNRDGYSYNDGNGYSESASGTYGYSSNTPDTYYHSNKQQCFKLEHTKITTKY